MPTESFALAEASPSYTGIVRNQKTGTRKSDSVKDWAGALEAGGWTKSGELKPWMTLRIDAAHLPVRSPEPPGGDDDKLDGAVVCTFPPAITVSSPGGTGGSVWAWDPGVYKEPPCSSFPLGSSPGTTFENFKSALQEATGMVILSEGGDGNIAELTLEHPVAGPQFNGLLVGGWTGGEAWYGGYAYGSGTYRGRRLSVEGAEGPGWAGGEYHAFEFTARVHEGALDLSGGPPQKFSVWLSRAQNSPYPWRICACPFQFAIWMDQYGDAGAGAGDTPYPRSAIVSMPWVPEGYTGHDCFAFVATGILGVFRGHFAWSGHTWFDDGPWSPFEFTPLMVPVLRTRGEVTTPDIPDRITTTQGLLLTDNAYVTASRDPDRPFVIGQRIAGKLWNCCTVSDSYSFGTVYSDMMDARWIHLSSHRYYPDYAVSPFLYGAQKASLWWKVDSGDVITPETA